MAGKGAGHAEEEVQRGADCDVAKDGARLAPLFLAGALSSDFAVVFGWIARMTN